jgi:hypothetical protein
MRGDIVAMMECDSILLLPHWERSRGASLEYKIACDLGFDLYYMAHNMEAILCPPGTGYRTHVAAALVGWETCTYMQVWDSRYGDVVEPDRWREFTCPQHDAHELVIGESGSRSYLGKHDA